MAGIFTRYGAGAAALSVLVIGVSVAAAGGRLFTPGQLGKAHEHLAGDCGQCHAPNDAGTSIDRKCLACHQNIRKQQTDTLSLHARVADARCLACHTDHRGYAGSLTRFDALSSYDHPRFPLTGAHARVSCAGCHGSIKSGATFKRAQSDCMSCHQKDDKHNGGYGPDCAACHTTATWSGVSIRHTFPLAHGTRGGNSACTVCHKMAGNWKSYTCYGCHAHTPAGIQARHDDERINNLNDCVRCHATGREHD